MPQIAPLSQQHFLDLVARVLPPDYVAALQSPGPGYEFAQAFAEIAERLSLAAFRFDQDSHMLSASGAGFARVVVKFARPTFAAGALVVKAGTVVGTSRHARQFLVVEDAVFGALDLGPISVQAVAVRPGYEFNVEGARFPSPSVTLAGEIDTVVFPIQDPPFTDPTITVSQSPDATGGHPPTLDQLGADRGLPRRPDEGDEIYRARVRALPDTVSPDAMKRLIAQVLRPYNLTAEFIETWDVRYQTCWDGPSAAAGQYLPNLFCYDDPRPLPVYPNPQFRNRWLDTGRGEVIVVVPNVGAVSDVGMAYDDTAVDSAAHVTSGFVGGRRAYSAYDVTSMFDPALGAQGAYDGFDLKKQALYRGLYEALQQIKAGGVTADVEVRFSPSVAGP